MSESIFSIITNQTVTTDGSKIFHGEQGATIALFWNISAVTGTIQFSMTEVDPTDDLTPNGVSNTSNVISSPEVGRLLLHGALSPSVLISWAVTGGSPSIELSAFANASLGAEASSTGAAQDHTAANDPASVQLTDGVIFYKATTPADTQPISAVALPLPSGASTEAKQDIGNTSLDSIDTKIDTTASGIKVDVQASTLPVGAATEVKQDVGNTSLDSIDTKITITANGVKTDVQASVLPDGASTEAKQDIGNTSLDSIDTKIETTVNGIKVDVQTSTLPTGAATEATLATRLADATFTARINTLGQKTSANSTPIVIASDQSPIPVTGTVTETNDSIGVNEDPIPIASTQVGGSDGTNLHPINVDVTGKININNISGTVSLPTGAATEAKQDIGNLSLSSIDSKLVVADTDNVTIVNATGVDAVNIQDGGNSITVDGGVNATQAGVWNITDISGVVSLPTGASTEAKQDTGNSSLASIDSKIIVADSGNTTIVNAAGGAAVNIQDGGNSITVDGSVNAVQSGVWNITDISGTVSLPTGASTEAKQDVGNTSLGSIDSKIVIADTDNTTIVNGIGVAAVNIQDGGNSITVDGSVNAVQSGTWNITDISGVVSLPTGASTEAKQDTGNTSLASIDSKIIVADTANTTIVNGAGIAAVNIQDGGNSLTVDGIVDAVQSGTWNITDISGVVSLPTGAATEAKQDVGNLSLNSIDSKTIISDTDNVTIVNAAGIAAVNIQDGGNSITVDGDVNATQAGTWNITDISGTVSLPTGASTEAKQDVGNLSLSSIDSKIVIVDTANTTIVNGVGVDAVNIQDGGNSITVDGDVNATQAGVWNITDISGVVSLPTGAATEAKQDIGNTSLSSIDSKVVIADTDNVTIVNDVGAAAVNIQDGGNSITVDGDVNATQAGVWNITDISGIVSLPTGAATEVKQDTGNTSLSSIDSKIVVADTGNVTIVNASGIAAVNIQDGGNSITVDGIVDAVQSGVWNITDISGVVSLPTGASTEAKQIDGNASLTSIDSKIVIVDTANTTIVNAAGAAAVNIQDGGNSITVDGGVNATQAGVWNITDISGIVSLPTGASTEAKQDVGNLSLSSIDSKIASIDTDNVTIVNAAGVDAVNIQDGGNSITVDGIVDAVQSGTWNITDISGVVSLPTGAATEAKQDIGNTSLSSIDSKIVVADTDNVTIVNDVGAAAVNIQDGGNSITVDGSVNAVQSGTWNINDVSGTISLPTGASTALKQDTGNTSLASIDTKLTDASQKTKIVDGVGVNLLNIDVNGAVAVQSGGTTGSAVPSRAIQVAGTDGTNLRALNVDNTGKVNINNVSGTVSLPTGAATSAKQPNFGTAGVQSVDVITIQGDPAGTPVPVEFNEPLAFGGDGRLRVGTETMLIYEPVEGNAVNTNIWTQSQSGMTQTQSAGSLTLNAASSTTTGNYSILTSNKYCQQLSEFPIYTQFRARLIPKANAVIEMGFGIVSAASAPTDGAFFRFNGTTLTGVINFNGTETSTASLTTPDSANFYNIEVTLFEDKVAFEMESSDGAFSVDVDLPIPVTQGAPTSVSHLPVFARVYNSGTPATAAQVIIASMNTQQMDLQTNKAWGHQLAATAKGASTDPTTFLQISNFANSAAPSNATLSNTTASYTTLGGLFGFAAVAGAETDYALFAYQVPTGYQLVVNDIFVSTAITGANHGGTSTLLQWGVGINSNAVSLATGGTYPPVRLPIGMQSSGDGTHLGNIFVPDFIRHFETPLVVESGRFFHVILRIVTGAATGSEVIRGSVFVGGYFE